MSTNSATIAFRVKPEIKQRADCLFERLGMTTSTGMNILLMQTLEHRGFPFAIKLEDDPLPNKDVRKTLDGILDGSEALIGPFNNAEDMMRNILED